MKEYLLKIRVGGRTYGQPMMLSDELVRDAVALEATVAAEIRHLALGAVESHTLEPMEMAR